MDPADPVDANDPEFMATFNRMYEKTWGSDAISDAIPEKYKQLTGIALSISIRCDACLTYHIKMALKQKATKEEIVESFRIGLLSAGSGTIPTIRKGYATLKDLGIDVSGAK